MTYRTAYRRPAAARVARWMDLRYSGTCAICRNPLPAGSRAFYDPSDRSVTCTDLACCAANGLTREEWSGSPTSGGYVTVRAERRIVPKSSE